MILKAQSIFIALAILFLLTGCSSPNLTTTPPANTPNLIVITPTLIPSTPTLVPTELLPTQRPVDNLDDLIATVEELAAQDQFSGSILVARDDKVLWQFASGLANREANIPNRIDTQFNLGSMNKMFTAISILQLMEQGKLDLEDTIAQLLPDYPNSEVANQVTVHQLLTHTSGLGDVFNDTFNTEPNRYRSNTDFLPLFVDQPLQYIPGQQFSYSNAGYVVLGLIIESVSGQSYDDYVRTHIFEPGDMQNTHAYDIETQSPDLAIGYTTTDILGNPTGVLASNAAMMPGRGFAAGGGFSTIGDLFLFRNALLGHQFLNPESTELLITGKVQIRENSQYAYGFIDRIEAGQRMVGHTGGAPAVCSFLNIYLETGYTVAVLSNSDNDCMAVLTYLGDHPLR